MQQQTMTSLPLMGAPVQYSKNVYMEGIEEDGEGKVSRHGEHGNGKSSFFT
jgi:hypothetical protein